MSKQFKCWKCEKMLDADKFSETERKKYELKRHFCITCVTEASKYYVSMPTGKKAMMPSPGRLHPRERPYRFISFSDEPLDISKYLGSYTHPDNTSGRKITIEMKENNVIDFKYDYSETSQLGAPSCEDVIWEYKTTTYGGSGKLLTDENGSKFLKCKVQGKYNERSEYMGSEHDKPKERDIAGEIELRFLEKQLWLGCDQEGFGMWQRMISVNIEKVNGLRVVGTHEYVKHHSRFY